MHWILIGSSHPLIVAKLLLGVLAFAGSIMVASDCDIRTTLRRHWKYIGVGLVMTLAWRIPGNGVLFHGMEYEDSYVYTVQARQLLLGSHLPASNQTYVTSVCGFGIIEHCRRAVTFSGHYLGDPLVLSIAARLFGYAPQIGSWVGVLASCITLVLVFLIGSEISNEPLVPICSAADIWAPRIDPEHISSGAGSVSYCLSRQSRGNMVLAVFSSVH
jgi:hypothetical protein